MKIATHFPTSRAFTLIELLIVISIISLLTSLSYSAYQVATQKARKLAVKSDLAHLTSGLAAYHSDKSRMPVPASFDTESPIQMDEGSSVLNILLGSDIDGLNPSHQVYISPHPGVNRSGGLVGEKGHYGFLDAWGEPYYVIVDANLDNKIDNPDRSNSDLLDAGDSPAELITHAVAMSSGPDRKLGTEDDIVSWR